MGWRYRRTEGVLFRGEVKPQGKASVTVKTKVDESVALTPTIRFGIIAVKREFITRDDLDRGMRIQLEEDIDGKQHRLIGRILFDLGLLTLGQIEEVLTVLFDDRPKS